MAGTTLDLENLIDPDDLAKEISLNWIEWDKLRVEWK